ncbi:MAG: cache domain-containing protein [Candidatus Tenebribacter mawsonii]|nr:cache domain-containing protein [Candidatus Tenebribacter mawsonii]
MNTIFVLLIIILINLNLLSVSPQTNAPIKETLKEQSSYAGSALASHEDKVKYGTPIEAKTMVEDAISFMQGIDIEDAFTVFNSKGGRFHYKDLYLFVFDMDGTILSHGAEIALIGKNLIDLKDSAGKYFVKDFINLMKESNNGWKEYYWRNYETQKVEMKLTYLKRFNENIFVGCGAYQPRY